MWPPWKIVLCGVVLCQWGGACCGFLFLRVVVHVSIFPFSFPISLSLFSFCLGFFFFFPSNFHFFFLFFFCFFFVFFLCVVVLYWVVLYARAMIDDTTTEIMTPWFHYLTKLIRPCLSFSFFILSVCVSVWVCEQAERCFSENICLI